MIPDHRLDADSLAELYECWLAGKSRRGCIVVRGINRWHGRTALAANTHEPSVDFSEQGEVQLAERRQLEHRLDHVGAHDGLRHAKEGSAESRRFPLWHDADHRGRQREDRKST